MSATIQCESADGVTVHIAGTLSPADLSSAQQSVARLLETRGVVSLLVIAEHFEGFGPGKWHDMSFQREHDRHINRIAIIAQERWEELALMFAGAGVRRVEIQFFAPRLIEQARQWLSEQQ
jgi:hypothetical protein